jgi:nucleoside-diphosphate-sugar epimerase
MRTNQLAAVNLLAAAAQSAPDTRIVLAGSIEENLGGAPSPPTSPYTAAMLATTSYAAMFAMLWGLRVSVLRTCMV